MNRRFSGWILFGAAVALVGAGNAPAGKAMPGGTSPAVVLEDGTQPLPPPILPPPHVAAMNNAVGNVAMEDGTQPLPPPVLPPPHAKRDGTQPFPPPVLPPRHLSA
jgi:hypothetical protein